MRLGGERSRCVPGGRTTRAPGWWGPRALLVALAVALSPGAWPAPGAAAPPATAQPQAKTGDLVGTLRPYTTVHEDTLLDVARAQKLGLIELMAANPGVDPWLPGEGVTLQLPSAHLLPDAPRRGLVVNTAELRLYYFDEAGQVHTFPLGVGREGYLTPQGQTTVVRKTENPTWYPTPSILRDNPDLPSVVPPGPDNPLGEHAIYLGWSSYLIHGTNIPWGVGRRASRGCLRMYPEDIAWLFPRVKVGTPVTVVEQSVKLGWHQGELYLEAHPSVRQIDAIEEASKAPGPPEPLAIAEWADPIIKTAADASERLDWPAIEKALAERTGLPVRVTRPASLAANTAPAATPSPTR